MKPLGLIIQREYLSKVKTKAFILTTLLMPFLMVAVMFLPAILMNVNDTKIKNVYVIDNTDKYHSLFESNTNYTFIHVTEEAKPETMDALLQINGNLSQNANAVTFYSEQQQPPADLMRYIDNTLTEAIRNEKIEDFTQAEGLAPQVVTNLQTILKSKDKISVSAKRWVEDGSTQDTLNQAVSAVGMGLTLFMFMFIMMYGSIVMQSVVEEKSNRIVEVIISSVKPFDLMMGKIIGVALTGITQLVIWGVLGGVMSIIGVGILGGTIGVGSISPDMQQMATQMNNTPQVTDMLNMIYTINWVQIIVCFILYFIGGYLLFASIFAMFGSAANDSQEAQQFMTPVMVILMFAFYAGFAAARNPEGSLAFWCSMIPFTSSIAMMVRTPFEVPMWELVVSIVLLYATVIVMVQLAAKIYRTGILMYGKKPSFAELAKWLRYK